MSTKNLASGKFYLFDPDAVEVITDPAHPLFDARAVRPNLHDEPEFQALVTSLGFEGNITPIKVAKLDGHELPVVTDGRMRTLAARVVKAKQQKKSEDPEAWIKLRGIFEKGEADDLPTIAAAANIRIASTVLENARKAAHLAKMGMKPISIARAMGVETQTIHNWQTLLAAPAETKAAVAAGKKTAGDAIKEVRETRKAATNGGAPATSASKAPPRAPRERNQIPIKTVRQALVATRTRLSDPGVITTPSIGAMVALLAVLTGETPLAKAPAEVQWLFSNLAPVKGPAPKEPQPPAAP